MRKEFSFLGDLVKSGIERVGLKGAVQEKAALDLWADVVGEKTASVTRAERVIDGVVYVSCRDSMWAQELHFLRPVIIKKLNEKLGANIIKEIRLSGRGFKKNKDSEEEKGFSKKRSEEPSLTENELERIKQAAEGIEDPEFAERFMRALKSSRIIRKKHE
ncbi:MAG: DUF721 domain-containing protein [Armatimonadota bacterium]